MEHSIGAADTATMAAGTAMISGYSYDWKSPTGASVQVQAMQAEDQREAHKNRWPYRQGFYLLFQWTRKITHACSKEPWGPVIRYGFLRFAFGEVQFSLSGACLEHHQSVELLLAQLFDYHLLQHRARECASPYEAFLCNPLSLM